MNVVFFVPNQFLLQGVKTVIKEFCGKCKENSTVRHNNGRRNLTERQYLPIYLNLNNKTNDYKSQRLG